jgi:dUTP pyrophosphatase
MYGRISPRSGLSVKHQIDVGTGVIDSDDQGEVKVLLINHGKKAFHVSPGLKTAQLILQHISSDNLFILAS